MANYLLSEVVQGLSTVSFTASAADQYVVDIKTTLPTLTTTGGTQQSSLVTTININASPFAVYAAGTRGSQTRLSLAQGDIVTIVFSSSNPVDSALNAIQSVIAISEGA